jgi:hypothetical protein
MTINIIECYRKFYVLEYVSLTCILFNVLNILSQLHEDMLPISVTITYWLQFDYCGPLHCPFLYDNGSLINIKWVYYFIALSKYYKMLVC